MRLWHKDLIGVLPQKQLLGQWRECCAIAKAIKEKGTPNHLLVNKVMKFPIDHLYSYAAEVIEELQNRGYNAVWESIEKHLPKHHLSLISHDGLFDTKEVTWHNYRYFWQCYSNLQEKHDCGGISDQEFRSVYSRAIEYLHTNRTSF